MSGTYIIRADASLGTFDPLWETGVGSQANLARKTWPTSAGGDGTNTVACNFYDNGTHTGSYTLHCTGDSTAIYVDGVATSFAGLPAGFTPTSATVFTRVTDPGGGFLQLQYDAGTVNTEVAVTSSPQAFSFAYPGNIPSILDLLNNGFGVTYRISAGTSYVIIQRSTGNGLYIAGSYDIIGTSYYNPVTDHYEFAASDPGSPWVVQAVGPTPAPVSVDPASGCTGTAITITGTGFDDAATVAIGGVACTSVVVVDQTTITCVTGAHADGLVDVVVTNPGSLTGTLVGGYTYGTPWWMRTFTITLDGEDFTFEVYTQSCTEPPEGFGWTFQGLTAPSLVWWYYATLGWYAHQVSSPRIGWTDRHHVGWVLTGSGGSTPPADPDGWFVSPFAFGGGINVMTDRPKEPRTWADISVWATANTGMLGGSPAASATVDNHLLYPATEYTVGTDYPPIRVFDGSFDHELCQLPPTTSNAVPKAVMSMLAADGTCFVSSFDSGTTSADWRGRVFQLDLASGALTALGTQFAAGEMPYALAWHMDRLWCGTNNGIGTVGKVYYFRPGIDTDWTLDHSLATESLGGVDSMISFQGKLYVGSDNSATNRGKILVRDSAGAYTVSETGSGGTAVVNNGYLAMAVFGTNLYASYWNNDGTAISKIRKFDGTSWTTAYSGASGTLRPFILLFQDTGTLFAVGGGKLLTAAILSTTDGTTWTNLTAELPETNRTILPIYGIEVF